MNIHMFRILRYGGKRMTDYYHSEEAIKMLEEYEERNDCKFVNYVFEIQYKRESEKEYRTTYELCEFDVDDNLTWDSDWNEGETDVIFKRVVPLELMCEYYFEHTSPDKDEWNNK